MHPGQTFEVSEPIIARDSNIRTEVKAVTKDGLPVVVDGYRAAGHGLHCG
jgi:hypothetical protein